MLRIRENFNHNNNINGYHCTKRILELDPMDISDQLLPSKRPRFLNKDHHSSPIKQLTVQRQKTPQKHPPSFNELIPHKKKLPANTTNNEKLQMKKSNELKIDTDNKKLFTYPQIIYLCERLLKEQNEKLRDEYDEILRLKLAEQYDTFMKFTHDQMKAELSSESQSSYFT